ncbi:MAG: hypothetical protein LBR17_07025 [Bacteroidales bacterium]|jgi:hypothetical protein|nr:hypothetical protein [Bacteroidales bacterium]
MDITGKITGIKYERTISENYYDSVIKKCKAVLKLTSGKILNGHGVNFWLRNNFSKSQTDLLNSLFKEAEENGFYLTICKSK